MADLTTGVDEVVDSTDFKSLAVTGVTDNGGNGDVVEVAMTEGTEVVGPVFDELMSYGFTPRFWDRAGSKLQFVRR